MVPPEGGHLDIVNEAVHEDGPFRESAWSNGIGDEYVERAFEWTDEVTDADLFHNDYDITVNDTKADAVYDLPSDFLDRGVPIDGVGFQLHPVGSQPDPDRVGEAGVQPSLPFARPISGAGVDLTRLPTVSESWTASWVEGGTYGVMSDRTRMTETVGGRATPPRSPAPLARHPGAGSPDIAPFGVQPGRESQRTSRRRA